MALINLPRELTVIIVGRPFKQLRQVCSEWRAFFDADDWYTWIKGLRVSELPLPQTIRLPNAGVLVLLNRLCLSDDAIRHFAWYIDWFWLCRNQLISIEIADEFTSRIYWSQIQQFGQIDPQVLRKYYSNFDAASILSRVRDIPEDIIEKYISLSSNARVAIEHQALSEPLLNKLWAGYKGVICLYQHLSEGFLREHCDTLDWRIVSTYQALSESFVNDFAAAISWTGLIRNRMTDIPFEMYFAHYTIINWSCADLTWEFTPAQLAMLAGVGVTWESKHTPERRIMRSAA
jgi:hypothetical protein